MPLNRFVFLAVIAAALLFPALAAAEDVTYVVQPGDTLFRISQQYGVSIDAIAQANNISNREQIFSGQKLTIPDLTEAVDTDLFAGEPLKHVVQPGETLASIANRYGLTVRQIAQINNITNPDRILRGQTLTVFAGTDAESAVNTDTAAAPAYTVPLGVGTPYVVQAGENLAEIAQRHGITWPAIVQANNISDPNRIKAGQVIILPDTRTVNADGVILPGSAGAPVPTNVVGKQIIVDLSDQRIYAYEDGVLVRNVLASTGLPATPTVRGNYKIQRKYESQTMSGPGYYLPGVQWIMYFYAGYAIHGTYWHNNFGQPMSHGCVNLPNDEALWFYNWAQVGTPILVQA